MGLNQQWSNEKLLFFTLDCLCQHLYRILHSKCVYFHSKCLNLYHQWVKLRKKWVNYYQEVHKSLCCFLLHRPYQGLATVTQRSTTLLTQNTFIFRNVSPNLVAGFQNTLISAHFSDPYLLPNRLLRYRSLWALAIDIIGRKYNSLEAFIDRVRMSKRGSTSIRKLPSFFQSWIYINF